MSADRTAPHPEVSGGAIGRAGVQVAAHGGDRGVPERLLDEVDECTPVEAVAGVGVAQSKIMPLVYSRERQIS